MSELDPRGAYELLRGGDVQLVDVRRPDEYEAGRLAGARHIEIDRLAAEATSIDRGRPILFYCRSGSRSALATQAFESAGFDAHNLDGGLIAWVRAGLPIEPEDGHVAG
ncbi:MAG TPA: rhodanese-like domain-containing protein [Thermoleophilaceae bacterium]|nr:rhodanese-like domain-containing protein [Thermoleophilaceae bacterium]